MQEDFGFAQGYLGEVYVYQYNSGTWSIVGDTIQGGAVGDEFGYDVDCSEDGNIIAISARKEEVSGGVVAGVVRVYENNAGTWTQLGADFEGDALGDDFGTSVSLNDFGNRIAIGAPLFNEGDSVNSGLVKVYDYNSGNNTWSQVGSTLKGTGNRDQMGTAISLSEFGNTLAVGLPFADSLGEVRIYELESGDWTQRGTSIFGDAKHDFFGTDLSLSNDGETVVIGASLHDGIGTNSGQVKVYDLSAVVTSVNNSLVQKYVDGVFPNPFRERLSLNFKETVSPKLTLIDANGLIFAEKEFSNSSEVMLETGNIPAGIYLLKITIEDQFGAVKVIKN